MLTAPFKSLSHDWPQHENVLEAPNFMSLLPQTQHDLEVQRSNLRNDHFAASTPSSVSYIFSFEMLRGSRKQRTGSRMDICIPWFWNHRILIVQRAWMLYSWVWKYLTIPPTFPLRRLLVVYLYTSLKNWEVGACPACLRLTASILYIREPLEKFLPVLLLLLLLHTDLYIYVLLF